MQRVGVFYATKEGHAHKVAERVAAALTERTLDVAVHHVSDVDASEVLARSDAAVVVGSVHLGKHEPQLVAFVKANRTQLDAIPTALLSVCGEQAGAEQGSTPEARAKSAANVSAQLQTFIDATGWHPRHVRPIAGAFAFTHYNAVVRWVMKRIAKREGLPTDTSRDYDFTNWTALDEFSRSLAEELRPPSEKAV